MNNDNNNNGYNRVGNNTLSVNNNIGRVPEDDILDSQGNVHVNKYYNKTRNHNLSVASKMSDMSQMPAPSMSGMGGGPLATYNTGNTLGVNQGAHKYSVASNTASDNSNMLWMDGDFSERRSIATQNNDDM